MPARLFVNRIPPQRIRTFLVLFGVALTLPLLAIALLAFHQMTHLEEQELERRVQQVALDLGGDIDRELDRAMVTLETLATSPLLAQGDYAAFHEQAARAISADKAGILLVDAIDAAAGQHAERRSARCCRPRPTRRPRAGCSRPGSARCRMCSWAWSRGDP